MARINRTDVIQKAVNDLAISTSSDKVPNETLDKVQLTYDLNRTFSNFVVSGASVVTGTLNASPPTVSTGSETYITSISAGFIKDSTCDIATGRLVINVTPAESGIAAALLCFPVITVTAQDGNLSVSFPYPIKIKNGSAVQWISTYSLGVMSRTISATGYTTTSN